MLTIDERIRKARRELEALQTSTHPAQIEQKQRDYLEALSRERAGVAAHHAAALRRGDAREKIPSPFVRGEYVEGELTGFEAARRLERRLGDIDAELARTLEAAPVAQGLG